ncbi:MAG: tRNA pseudouridine(38-40) synthase TruA [Planctomycetota bacterium]|jgi:tRNA pseudouridine38-40 synthase
MQLSSRRRMQVAYDGAAYAGWQVQPDQPTVQGVLEAALMRACGQAVRVTGSGRTDAGVHALGQVAHFDDPLDGDPERLRRRLLASLPPDVRVLALESAPADFHARHAALDKTYFYQLHLVAGGGGARAVQAGLPPHRRRTFHAVPAGLDVPAMRRAARVLEGRHDFTGLSKVMDPDRGTVRTLRRVRVRPVPSGLRLFATADGFLYGMVRLLAGLLVEVGRGRSAPEEIGPWLARADRSRGPPSLPPHALFLWKVRYAEDAAAPPRLLS